jgi:hypothetical protein
MNCTPVPLQRVQVIVMKIVFKIAWEVLIAEFILMKYNDKSKTHVPQHGAQLENSTQFFVQVSCH